MLAGLLLTLAGCGGSGAPSTEGPFVRLAAGWRSVCATHQGGRTQCWGDNELGGVGNGSTASAGEPVPLRQDPTFDLTDPGLTSCGVDHTGVAWCWGGNEAGALGIGTLDGPELCGRFACATVAEPVTNRIVFHDIRTGLWSSCALAADGVGYCWGLAETGQLGIGPLAVNDGRVLPCLSGFDLCAVSPTQVDGGHHFTRLDIGERHACGLAEGNAAWCWGANEGGLLGRGDGAVDYVFTPVSVAGGHRFAELTLGDDHACALDLDGAAWCWGEVVTRSGTLVTQASAPALLSGSLRFVALAAGGRHTCGITTDSAAWCWGANDDGELGDGSLSASPAPVAVAGGFRFTAIAAGEDFSCGLTTTRRVYCWGANGAGQLGDGSFRPSAVPVRVAGQS